MAVLVGVFWHRVLPLDYFPEQILLVVSPKGLIAKQHGVEQHSRSPHIHSRNDVLLLLAELWRHISWCTAKSARFGVEVGVLRRKSKVYELGRVPWLGHVDEDVVKLDVSVGYVMLVAKRHSLHHLGKNLSACILGQVLSAYN